MLVCTYYNLWFSDFREYELTAMLATKLNKEGRIL